MYKNWRCVHVHDPLKWLSFSKIYVKYAIVIFTCDVRACVCMYCISFILHTWYCLVSSDVIDTKSVFPTDKLLILEWNFISTDYYQWILFTSDIGINMPYSDNERAPHWVVLFHRPLAFGGRLGEFGYFS